jgi:hypothetical protein
MTLGHHLPSRQGSSGSAGLGGLIADIAPLWRRSESEIVSGWFGLAVRHIERLSAWTAWQARLEWAIATARIGDAKQALTHLPAAAATPAQAHRFQAWFAANRGDIATELGELDRSCSSDPANATALARLAQLAERVGQPRRAAEILRKKFEVERIRARYMSLHERKQPIRHAVEMAHLAERLGRTFEARAFLTVAISEDADRRDLWRDLARLGSSPRAIIAPGRTLAEVVDERGDRRD